MAQRSLMTWTTVRPGSRNAQTAATSAGAGRSGFEVRIVVVRGPDLGAQGGTVEDLDRGSEVHGLGVLDVRRPAQDDALMLGLLGRGSGGPMLRHVHMVAGDERRGAGLSTGPLFGTIVLSERIARSLW